MLTLNNTTYFHSVSGTTNPTVNLSSLSGAGHWLLLYISADFPKQFTIKTNQNESFSNIGITTGSAPLGGFWLLQSTLACTSAIFTSTHVGSNDVYYAAIFEVSGISLQYVNQGGVNGGGDGNTHAFESSGFGTSIVGPALVGGAGISLYVEGLTTSPAAGSAPTINVTAGWMLDTSSVSGLDGLASAYIVSTGTQQPTFTTSAVSAIALDVGGILIQDSGGGGGGTQVTSNIVTSTADVIWWHPQFAGVDSEIAAMEGMINEGGSVNIPWLLGIAVAQGNGMTEAIAKSGQFFEDSTDGGGGGNEGGAQNSGGSGGLIVSW